MSKMRRAIGGIAGGLLMAAAIAPVAFGDNPGETTFKQKCAMCHGPDGKGETNMGKTLKLRDLGSADVQKQTDAQLTDIVTNGKGKMQAYKGKLTDDQIKQVVAFVRSLAKK